MRTINRYLSIYQDGLMNWWAHITFWEYITLMIISLIAGYIMMKSCRSRSV